MIPALELSYIRLPEKSNPPADSEDCPICFTELPDTFRNLIMSPNSVTINQDLMIHRPDVGKNHVFHLPCMQEWFKENKTCPSCKADLTSFNIPDPSVDAVPPEGSAPQNDALHPEVALEVAAEQNGADVAVVVNQIQVPQNPSNHCFRNAAVATISVGLCYFGGALLYSSSDHDDPMSRILLAGGVVALMSAATVMLCSLYQCQRGRNNRQ